MGLLGGLAALFAAKKAGDLADAGEERLHESAKMKHTEQERLEAQATADDMENLVKLKDLFDQGIISRWDYENQKRALLRSIRRRTLD